MRNKSGKYVVISIVATFAALFILFALIQSNVIDENGFVVGKDPAYDAASDSGYAFVESESKNGVKYYVISRSTANLSTAVTSGTSPESQTVESRTSSREDDTDAFAELNGMTVGESRNSTTAGTTASTVSTTKTTVSTTKSKRKSNEKIAYLTFDDGPSINTEKLLDILDRYDVKATFFVIYHKNMEKKYRKIVERGHTIALHSYTHSYSKIYSTEKGYYEDLNKIHDYIEKVTGVDSRIIRFPGGSSNTVSRKYNKTIMKTLKQSVTDKGYIFHDWNVDSTDASGINRDPDLLVEKVETGLKSKPVVNILMHDTGKSKTTTVEALPRIIEAVKAKGYRIEPLTEDSEVIQHRW